MKKFDELVNKRQSEIDTHEKNTRKDQGNFEASVGLGVLGVAIGGFLAYIASIVAFGIITVGWRIIYAIWIVGYGGPPAPPLGWENVFKILVTLAGVGMGWFAGYSGNRTTGDKYR